MITTKYIITWITDEGQKGKAIRDTPWEAEQTAMGMLGVASALGTICETQITDHNGNTDYFKL